MKLSTFLRDAAPEAPLDLDLLPLIQVRRLPNLTSLLAPAYF